MSGANLSQHLAVLKAAGTGGTRLKGKRIHCYLPIPKTKKVCEWMLEVLSGLR